MTDNHVHIGQFEDVYYDGPEIIETVMGYGMKGLSFSSTTSCKDDVRYEEVEREIKNLLAQIGYPAEIVRPFFWYIPDYINQKISIPSAFSVIPYKGLKLHPCFQNWDFDDKRHLETLHCLFDYAEKYELPVLIHTGHNGVDSADRFERFFGEYPKVKCILAHCRPLEKTVEMLKKYTNVLCDTAFVPEADIQHIITNGFKDKIVLGTDFPVTHFFSTKYPKEGENPMITFAEQYAKDIFGASLIWRNIETNILLGKLTNNGRMIP
jgi:predicted TIM-barrel fold metal-dependent hydrolase